MPEKHREMHRMLLEECYTRAVELAYMFLLDMRLQRAQHPEMPDYYYSVFDMRLEQLISNTLIIRTKKLRIMMRRNIP